MTDQPIASISVDLDNKWSYLKVRGESSWVDFPGYLDTVVPRIVRFLDERDLLTTFFVVGQDASLRVNQEPIAMLAEEGHEIGNHSFHHEPWLHLYSQSQLEDEFDRSEYAIERVTGMRPVGFRGPGFSCCRRVLQLLMRRGYLYDGSTFATSLGPVARAYYMLNARFSKAQMEERKELFGSFSDAFQRNKPFVWTNNEDRLVEIPVTTMPLTRFPIHVSYLNYLATMSVLLARTYFWKAITLCRLTGTTPSLLLHPTDFLSEEDVTEMAFFPGMTTRAHKKMELLSECLEMMSKHYEIVTMRQQAEHVLEHRHVSRPISNVAPGLPEKLLNEA
jgi:peptidoglycan/xylan/chitin deacetylase (PgdA/CDA1 family)